MATHYLTDDFIRSYTRPSKGYEIVYDGGQGAEPGFAVRFTPTGQPTCLFCYYVPGSGKDGGTPKKRRMVLGKWKDARGNKRSSTVADMRKLAGKYRGQVDEEHRDPYAETWATREREAAQAERERQEREREAAEAEAARKAEDARLTVTQLMGLFLDPEDGRKLSPDSVRRAERRFARHVKPTLGDRKADEVNQDDVLRLIKPLRKAAKRCEVVHVVTQLSGLYAWGMANKHLRMPDNANPAEGILAFLDKAGELPDERERALSKASEFRAFWHITDPLADVAPGAKLPADMAECLRLILFTGARPSEAAGLKWSEIDMESAVWNKPKQGEGRSKSKRGDTLPLVAAAMAILRARAATAAPGSIYVFPSGRNRDDGTEGCLTANRLATSLRDAMPYMAVQGIEPFTPHDVRRTVATGMGEIGVSDEIVELTLNHALPKLKKTYDLSRKVRIRRRAMEAWVGYFLNVVKTGVTVDQYEDDELPYTDNVVQFPMRMGVR